MSDITERITTYLINGGAFIPELADHRAVRDLLIDARTDLAALRTDLVAERERADAHYRALENVTAKKERLRAALERIANTDPDDGTAWFHSVANAALNKGGGDE